MMLRFRCPALALHALYLALLLGTATGASAQAVRGRVLDGATREPLVGAQIHLIAANGDTVRQILSAVDGVFYLPATRPGSYRVEGSYVGYAAARTELLTLGTDMLVVDLRMSSRAIVLDPLSVTARRRDHRHDATYDGFYARRVLHPPVGPRRAVAHTDAPLKAALTAADVLSWFTGLKKCRIVYWGSHVINGEELAELQLQQSVQDLEGVEFYRNYDDAPIAFRVPPTHVRNSSVCSIIVLWPKRPGVEVVTAPRPTG